MPLGWSIILQVRLADITHFVLLCCCLQPMSKLAESHSEMEFYFIHFGPIRSYGGSHLGPVMKDTAGFHSK